MTEFDLYTPERRAQRAIFYTLPVWRRIRKVQLNQKPLCQMCEEEGRLTPATVCDHADCMWPPTLEGFTKGPFNSLCHMCHGIKTKEVDLPRMRRAEKLKLRSF